MEISESLFWGCYVAFCGQAMRVLAEEPCFLCHFHWYNFKLILMCYSSVVILPYQVSCRGMATELKDYESHYDRLEIHPECTKTEIRCGFGMSLSFFSIIPIITSSSIQLWQYNFIHIYKVGRCLARYSPRAKANNSKPCNAIRYNAMTCRTMQYHKMQSNTMQYHTMPCDTME